MFDLDNVIDIVIDNIKKLFFPEEWIKLDMKFSKLELFTLLYLSKRKEITMTELVDYINCPMSTATGIVDRLVRNGYVQRDRGEADRRIVILKLTNDGEDFIKNLQSTISNYVNTILVGLTEEEKRSMTSIILKVINNLHKKSDLDTGGKEDSAKIKTIDIE